MIPIRVRHFPALLNQNLQKYRLLKKSPARRPTFHLCYFSCHSYFKYLYCSLHSLTVHAKDIELKISIFNDEEQPISAAQIAEIERLIPGTRVMLWPKSMGWGAKQIGSIWDAYALAITDAHEDDFVARVDSDVFFFNDTIFRAVERSDADLIGDGHFDEFKFCQGGCYFFRVKAARRVRQAIAAEGMDKMLEGLKVVADDRAASFMADKLGLKTWMTWFIMFPNELKNAGRLNAWSRWKFSCLHSINKNKALMLEAYERELYGGKCPEDYRVALQTV